MKLFSYYISECEQQTNNLTNKINSNKQAYGLKEDERINISLFDELELMPSKDGEFLIPKEYIICVSIKRFWIESFLDDDITEVVDIERAVYVYQSHFTVDSEFFATSPNNLEKLVVENLEISK
jgi:hypothetical protein